MSRRSGFTLIELMAVVVIASLVTAMGAISIGNVIRQTRFQRTVSAFAQMDARARFHARTGGFATEMAIDSERATASVLVPALESEESTSELSTYAIPEGLKVSIEVHGPVRQTAEEATSVTFDRLGTSSDYVLTLRDDLRVMRFEFAGLTGDMRQVEATP